MFGPKKPLKLDQKTLQFDRKIFKARSKKEIFTPWSFFLQLDRTIFTPWSFFFTAWSKNLYTLIDFLRLDRKIFTPWAMFTAWSKTTLQLDRFFTAWSIFCTAWSMFLTAWLKNRLQLDHFYSLIEKSLHLYRLFVYSLIENIFTPWSNC